MSQHGWLLSLDHWLFVRKLLDVAFKGSVFTDPLSYELDVPIAI
jgi:hypothetical protein